MPHITVEMLPGRTEEKKQRLAKALSEAAALVVDVDVSDVSVSIKEIEKDDWKRMVYDRVEREKEALYKAPKKM